MFDRKNEGRWWDFGWQLVEGCNKVSPGCENCWSLIKESRFRKETGVVFHGERLERPLKRKKPTSYAIWNDLFHESISPLDIGKVFDIIEKCPQHTFMILTKRPDNMKFYFDAENEKPFPNVWLGVTAENQQQANKRIPILLDIPAEKRFVSVEPMLGEVDLRDITYNTYNALMGLGDITGPLGQDGPKLDYVICGSESGPRRRECDEDWVRSIRDQCLDAKTPFFLKQLHRNGKKVSVPKLDGKKWEEMP